MFGGIAIGGAFAVVAIDQANKELARLASVKLMPLDIPKVPEAGWCLVGHDLVGETLTLKPRYRWASYA